LLLEALIPAGKFAGKRIYFIIIQMLTGTYNYPVSKGDRFAGRDGEIQFFFFLREIFHIQRIGRKKPVSPCMP